MAEAGRTRDHPTDPYQSRGPSHQTNGVCSTISTHQPSAVVSSPRDGSAPVPNGSSAGNLPSYHSPAYCELKTYHDEAFLYIEQGLFCDELGQGEQAVILYQKGLNLISKAQDTHKNGTPLNHQEIGQVQPMMEKMERFQPQIQSRIDELGADAAVAQALQDPPPSCEQATSPCSSVSMTSEDLDELGDDILEGSEINSRDGATEIFSIPEGVQIFYINPEGCVTAPSYPSSLKIYKFVNSTHDSDRPPAFLQVGDWTYPLLPGGSPALFADSGAYIFPNVLATEAGSSVGVILPPDVDDNERRQFLRLLSRLTNMWNEEGDQVQIGTPEHEDVSLRRHRDSSRHPITQPQSSFGEEDESTRTSTKISKGLLTAASWISWGLEKGAEKTGELIRKGSGKLKETINPEDEPSKIDPRVQEGMKYVHKASHTAVQVSGYIVNKLGEATLAIGRGVAPHIRKHGEKLLPDSWTKSDSVDGKSKMDDVIEVAGSGIQGFSTIFMSLEQAARALGRNIANETVSVVNHKYGADAGEVANHALYSVGNVAMTTRNANCLGVKAIAKKMAKDTGRAVLMEEGTDGKKSHGKADQCKNTDVASCQVNPRQERIRLLDLARAADEEDMSMRSSQRDAQTPAAMLP